MPSLKLGSLFPFFATLFFLNSSLPLAAAQGTGVSPAPRIEFYRNLGCPTGGSVVTIAYQPVAGVCYTVARTSGGAPRSVRLRHEPSAGATSAWSDESCVGGLPQLGSGPGPCLTGRNEYHSAKWFAAARVASGGSGLGTRQTVNGTAVKEPQDCVQADTVGYYDENGELFTVPIPQDDEDAKAILLKAFTNNDATTIKEYAASKQAGPPPPPW
ncbi:hypothetical protein EST38_g4497 [Candolleomyces aberdarensis]|uniref:Uncharacterized protein n=1 Tax=Candolleomyces aberdarensis TaxID=2316362 RepID=A0A4Q2DMT8_9AGAR|nr:hypothetical protein EST38_g4497 [Candolleomyces aberdarensis]